MMMNTGIVTKIIVKTIKNIGVFKTPPILSDYIDSPYIYYYNAETEKYFTFCIIKK